MPRVLFSLIAALMLWTTPAHAEITQCTNITSLPAIISTQGVYCLKQDLATNMTSGNAITINANNVTLDCNGWKVGGLAGGPATDAIGIYSEKLNVTIRDCAVRGFAVGVGLAGEKAGHLLEDNRLDNNTTAGIILLASGSIIRRNRILDTGGRPSYSHSTGIGTTGLGNLIADNFIDNVYATGIDGNSHGFGIDAFGAPTEISRNFITNIFQTGSSYNAMGIVAQGGASSIRDNTIMNQIRTRGYGISGGSSYSQCKGNSIHGFTELTLGSCENVFGNSSN